MGDERTHAEPHGQIEGLAIEALRSVEVRRLAACGGVGEDSQDSCLAATTADVTAGVEGVPGGESSVVFTAAQEIHLGEHLLHPDHDAWPTGTFAVRQSSQGLIDTVSAGRKAGRRALRRSARGLRGASTTCGPATPRDRIRDRHRAPERRIGDYRSERAFEQDRPNDGRGGYWGV